MQPQTLHACFERDGSEGDRLIRRALRNWRRWPRGCFELVGFLVNDGAQFRAGAVGEGAVCSLQDEPSQTN